MFTTGFIALSSKPVLKGSVDDTSAQGAKDILNGVLAQVCNLNDPK